MKIKVARLGILFLGLANTAFICRTSPERSPLPISEVGQIIDVTLAAFLPEHDSLSRVSVANRKIRLDVSRTLVAFGYQPSGALFGSLRLRSAVAPAAKSILEDCSVASPSVCAGLGWGAYVWIEPVSVTGSEAIVRLHASWVDRGGETYKPGSPPVGKGIQVGLASDAVLARAGDGKWSFVRRGAIAAGQ
jgi:hypothetical protein